MRFFAFFSLVFLAFLLLPPVAYAQAEEPPVPLQPGERRDEVTFSTENGPQFIVVRDFKVTEIQPTGKDDEYALTLLALSLTGEPDRRVMGSILFEIDGQSTLVPFQQESIGDVIVKAQPGASTITLRAVDSNVTHQVELPRNLTRLWLIAAGVVVLGAVIVVMRRRRPAQPTA